MDPQRKSKNVRLSPHVIPERYQIMIRPDLEGFTFYGEETIFLKISEPARVITLHTRDLDIESAEFITANNKEIWAGKISYVVQAETATFRFGKVIPAGKGKLKLIFRGILDNKMRGFYRSRYMHDGKEKYLATSQFEATDARRAFPCFDEPAHKAIFDVTLMIPKGLTAISNTIPTEIAEHESGYELVKFAPTPKMSTYLLAFIVGDFEYVEGRTRRRQGSGGQAKEGTLVRVFVTPGKKHQAEFALNTAIKVLSFYNNYFGIKYPLPVLDLIAIPDFAAGAMENWGAVTYRESALLVDPEHSSLQTKQWVALVIAHELAHQWFGNLVTMQWWTHLWLNEGFASYIEYLAIDHVFPQWDIWTQFTFNDLGSALKLDALANTHPIEIEVHHPNEIGEIFDAVSYSKGASIIRMLADFLGEKTFREGLRRYLKKHKYGNAVTGDLWQALEEVSRRPVGRIMRAWTQLPGYPILRTVLTPRGLRVEQDRFFSSPLSRAKAKATPRWPIPLVYGPIDTDREIRVLIEGKSIILQTEEKALKLNKGESGMLSVRYPDEYLPLLEKAVRIKKLSTRDRLGLLRDYFALAEAGELSAVKPLELSLSYKNEVDYTVWLELASGVQSIYSLVTGEKFLAEYKKYVNSLFSNIGESLGWEKKPKESHTQTLLRNLVISQRAEFGDSGTLDRAQKLFASFVRGKKFIDPDIRGAVYRAAAFGGNSKDYKTLIDLYKNSSLHEEKNRIGRALSSFKQKDLLKKTLQFSLTQHVRLQDAIGIIVGVGVNPYGRDVMWEFTKKNWIKLVNQYGQGGHLLPRLLQPLGTFNSEARAKEISQFFKKHPAPGGTRAILQALERVRSNAAWLNRDRGEISKWLKNH